MIHAELRLKTDAIRSREKRNCRRAEFFALPGFQHRQRFIDDFLDGPEAAYAFVAAR
jgi:hypothetical protein